MKSYTYRSITSYRMSWRKTMISTRFASWTDTVLLLTILAAFTTPVLAKPPPMSF
jgi:hypothetical protein